MHCCDHKILGGASRETKIMSVFNFSKNSFAAVAAVLILMPLLGCTQLKPIKSAIKTHNHKLVLANNVLTKVGKLAEDSFYACMVDGYLQGLSLDQVSDQCATKLLEDDGKGFGGPFGNIGHQDMFDPNKITASCASGDPTRAQSSGYGVRGNHGQYTWGGDPDKFYQLSKEESEKRKDEAIKKAGDELKLFSELENKEIQAKKDLDAAQTAGDQKAIDDAQKKYNEAHEKTMDQSAKAHEAFLDANADPNKKPPLVNRVGETSACQQALDSARDLLRECHRTAWKNFTCQQLWAKMHRCPDPALILVDPEQGYSCGASPDPKTIEAVKDAWVARCEQRVRYVPGGPNPCEPPKLEELGRIGTGKIGDVCNDPQAYINPDSNECTATFEVKPFGQPDIQQILVWGMNKLGGPIIVLPPRNPRPPQTGPQPRPKEIKGTLPF